MAIDIKIVAVWAPRNDDNIDPKDVICEVCRVNERVEDIRLDFADTTLWIPRWQLEKVLELTKED